MSACPDCRTLYTTIRNELNGKCMTQCRSCKRRTEWFNYPCWALTDWLVRINPKNPGPKITPKQ